jgi:hypothetical protein
MSSSGEALKMFDTLLQTPSMDDACLQKARELFTEYKEKGIIRSGSFEDNRWFFTDEYSNISIHFSIPKFSYKKYYESILQINAEQFIEFLKTFSMFSMGDVVLSSIRDTLYDINRLLDNDLFKFKLGEESLFLQHPSRVIEFFSMLPESNATEELEHLFNVLDCSLDYRYSLNSGDNKRALASIDSYFLFNDIMKDYWSGEIKDDERLFFYPLYLWWQITGVIPLRPREFILTPRKCLEKKNDGWYLTLCRNQLKGSNKKVSYKIEGDYITVPYHIPDRLANEILKYMDFTAEYESTELETLFITDTHYHKWNQSKHINSRYFTYINLNCVMRYFFHDIIEVKYGLKIVYDRQIKHLEKGCINYLHLGDTRHLALINIIAEGGTPVIAMMLAGHDSIDMAAHYYSNITSLIECRTYKQYRKVLKGSVTYEISRKGKLPLGIKDFVILEDKGRCYSPKFLSNDYSDCKCVSGPEGEIGYCPGCTYYRKNAKTGFFNNDDIYKNRINDDCKHLADIVRQVSSEKGNYEDILQAMLRLQSSSYNYQQYYEEKLLLQKGDIDG